MSLWRSLFLSAALSLVVAGCTTNDVSDYPDTSMDGDGAEYSQEETQVQIRKIYFDFDKSNLSDEAKASLEDIIKILQEQPSKNLLIVGHADERGTREYNIALGERRGNAAKDYIVGRLGVKDINDRIVVHSEGAENPEVIGRGEEVWKMNRRAVLTIVDCFAVMKEDANSSVVGQ